MRTAELALAVVCLIWGSTFVLVKQALNDVSTVLFLAVRFSCATAILLAVHRLRGGRFTTSGLAGGVLTGGLLYTGYLLQTMGLRHTTPAISGFITGLYIVMVPLLSAAVYRRMPRPTEWMGIVLATIGMGLLTLKDASFRVGDGELLTLGCAFAFAWHILALGHFSKRIDTDWLSLLQIAVCALIATSTFRVTEEPYLRFSNAVLVALIVTAVFATALAFWIQTWAQARTTPTRAALIMSLEPVFAWLASWIAEGEVLTVKSLAGAGCILAGILLVELRFPIMTVDRKG